MRVDTTERDDTPLICIAKPGTPDDIPDAAHVAWHDLEAVISPQARKLYGYWDPASREYRACYAAREDDDAEGLGLERGVLPGGAYRRARIKGGDAYGRIGETFDALARGTAVDETRPWVEVYRRHDEVDVLVPVKAET